MRSPSEQTDSTGCTTAKTRSLLGKLEKIETLPRDASHFTERADLLISLVEASVTILSKQGILKGNLYRAFLKHCPDYDPKS